MQVDDGADATGGPEYDFDTKGDLWLNTNCRQCGYKLRIAARDAESGRRYPCPNCDGFEVVMKGDELREMQEAMDRFLRAMREPSGGRGDA